MANGQKGQLEGTAAGGAIGSLFGGVGAVPGAAIGGLAGGVLGNLLGKKKKPPAPVPWYKAHEVLLIFVGVGFVAAAVVAVVLKRKK